MEQWLQTLPDLALFTEVARLGSFRQAAARLGMPPSTLSRRITTMESRLGVRLFLRTTRNVTLAPAARAYYEQGLQVIEAAERAQAALTPGRDAAQRIRISMPVDLGVEILGPVVATFAATRHGLRVDIDLSSRATDLLRDPVDLVFRVGNPLDDRVVARRIADIAAGLYASPALLKRIGRIEDAAQLVRVPCLNLNTGKGPMAWKVGSQRWAAAPGPHMISANSVALLRTLAEAGHGVALLPEHMAVSALLTRRLVRVLPEDPVPGWPLYAITASRLVPGHIGALISHVKSALKGTLISHKQIRRM